jgi:putative ABC transport system permease protein
MWTLTWKGVLANKSRFLLTALAVVLGTGFVAGALTFGDTLEDGFEELFGSFAGSSDVIVRPADAGGAPGAAAAEPGPSADEESGLDTEVVDRIAAVEDVRLVEGEYEGVAVLIGDDGEPIGQFGPPTIGYSAFDNTELDPAQLRDGRWPDTAGEVAIDAGTASGQEWSLGQEVEVVFDGPVETVEIVGIFGLGELDNLAGASVVAMEKEVAADRLVAGEGFTSVYVSGEAGTTPETLADRVATDLGEDVEVVTSAEFAEEQQAAIAPFIDIFSNILLVFAVIALLVGSFLIFNTFTIVLAGRMKELALLRAFGAGRRQLFRAVLGEAALVGLIGGTVGAAFGLAVALGLQRILAVVGIELPGDSLVVAPRTVVVAVIVGVVVTLLAAVVPARRAVRVPPVAALTEVALAAPTGSGRLRTILGAVSTVGGIAAVAATVVTDAGAVLLGVGAVAVLLGVAALAATVARPLAAVIGWPAARTGVSGELARANAMRNPRRTAATASALMIGLALVAFVSILAASLQATLDRTIEESFAVDAMVQATTPGGVPGDVVEELEATEELEVVAPVASATLEIGDATPFAAVIEPEELTAVFHLTVLDGDLDDFADGGVVVADGAADEHEVAAGDTITLPLPRGDRDVQVVAVVEDAGLDVSWFVDAPTFEDGGGRSDLFNVYLTFGPGVEAASGLAATETALEEYPQVAVLDQAGLAETIGEQLDQLLGVVVALLALSVLVALLGIVNTLALSVVERTREIGLLRAVGMTRGQVRRMVRGEAVTVALLGAGLGLAVGVPFGAVFAQLDTFGIDVFAVPWGQLTAGVVVAAVAGLVAGLLPARRAAKLDVLRALQTE